MEFTKCKSHNMKNYSHVRRLSRVKIELLHFPMFLHKWNHTISWTSAPIVTAIWLVLNKLLEVKEQRTQSWDKFISPENFYIIPFQNSITQVVGNLKTYDKLHNDRKCFQNFWFVLFDLLGDNFVCRSSLHLPCKIIFLVNERV